jgi:hypothetical protein
MKRTKSKYGKKASEKVARTLHEFKRGKLRSGGGGKVTSREQAIAIGLAQARRAGYKTPPLPRGHAAMNLDARVRAYLSNMQPGAEIDARGIARALGGVDPLAADYALERAERAGLAVTSDGRWFGPRRDLQGSPAQHHSTRKTPHGQLKREIDEVLSRKPHPSHATRKARAPRAIAYRIQLTPDELRAVEFARGRYAWPDMLSAHAAENGAVAFTESEMWQWIDDVDDDDSPFPLASGAFAAKLQRFYDSRI